MLKLHLKYGELLCPISFKKGKQVENTGITIHYEFILLFLYCFCSFLIYSENWSIKKLGIGIAVVEEFWRRVLRTMGQVLGCHDSHVLLSCVQIPHQEKADRNPPFFNFILTTFLLQFLIAHDSQLHSVPLMTSLHLIPTSRSPLQPPNLANKTVPSFHPCSHFLISSGYQLLLKFIAGRYGDDHPLHWHKRGGEAKFLLKPSLAS